MKTKKDTETKVLYPLEFDEFGEPPEIVIKAKLDLPGVDFWRWKDLNRTPDNTTESAATEFLPLRFLVISENGEDRAVTPTDLNKPPLSDAKVYAEVLYHADYHFGASYLAKEIRPESYGVGDDESLLWHDPDAAEDFKIIACESLNRAVLNEYRKRAAKDTVAASKWFMCQVYSIQSKGVVSPLEPSLFPRLKGADVTHEGDPRIGFLCWALMDAYLLKNWLGPYLRSKT